MSNYKKSINEKIEALNHVTSETKEVLKTSNSLLKMIQFGLIEEAKHLFDLLGKQICASAGSSDEEIKELKSREPNTQDWKDAEKKAEKKPKAIQIPDYESESEDLDPEQNAQVLVKKRKLK